MLDNVEVAECLYSKGASITGDVVEVALDATYKTNSAGSELYALLTEVDSQGFPLGYIFLKVAESAKPKAKTAAIAEFLSFLGRGKSSRHLSSQTRTSARSQQLRKSGPMQSISCVFGMSNGP